MNKLQELIDLLEKGIEALEIDTSCHAGRKICIDCCIQGIRNEINKQPVRAADGILFGLQQAAVVSSTGPKQIIDMSNEPAPTQEQIDQQHKLLVAKGRIKPSLGVYKKSSGNGIYSKPEEVDKMLEYIIKKDD